MPFVFLVVVIIVMAGCALAARRQAADAQRSFAWFKASVGQPPVMDK